MTKRQGKVGVITVFIQAACLLVLGALASVPARADVLNIGSKTQTGTLEGYDGRNFRFRNAEVGGIEEVSRTSVKDLRLDKPRKAEVVVMGKSAPEKMLLAGYAKGQFLFIQQDKKVVISGMRVKNITLEVPSMFGRPAGPAPQPVQQIDEAAIARLLARPDLTADQQATIERYRTAKQAYNEFLATSSAMVGAMDSMTGSDRIEALNALRLRKEAEQPLKHELAASQQALTATFPELLTGQTQAMPGGGGNAAGRSETITLTMPKLDPDEVLIIDTGVFKQLGSLTEGQTLAISGYEAAVAAYQKLPPISPAEAFAAAQQRLTATQQTLFQAFPNVQFVQQ